MIMEQDQAYDLAEALLQSFPNTQYHEPPIRTFTTGYSSSPVIVARFSRVSAELDIGLSGEYVVKITSEDEARRERAFFERFSKMKIALPDSFAPPLPDRSIVIDGMVAVVYNITFGSITKAQTLREALKDDRLDPDLVEKAISDLTQVLDAWYQQSGQLPDHKTRVTKPLDFLKSMIGIDKAPGLAARVARFVDTAWSAATTFEVIGLNRRLPNPVAYLEEHGWKRFDARGDWTGVAYLPSSIHGDLHTGNIMCLLDSDHAPMLIDFGSCDDNGCSLFDLAYLEYDIVRRSLPVDNVENRRQWLTLLDVSMREVPLTTRPKGLRALQTWLYLKPVRETVQRTLSASGNDAELTWWLATIAVGLNYARKGGDERPKIERESALLYAAYGLERLLAIHREDVTCEPSGLTMQWLWDQVAESPSLPIGDKRLKRLAEIILGAHLPDKQMRALYMASAPDDAVEHSLWRYPQAATPTETVHQALRRLAQAPTPTASDRPHIPPLLRFAAMLAGEAEIATADVIAWIKEAAPALNVDGALALSLVQAMPQPTSAPQAAQLAYVVAVVNPVPARAQPKRNQLKRYDLTAWLFIRERDDDPESFTSYLMDGLDETVKAAALEEKLRAKLQEWLDAAELDPLPAMSGEESIVVEFILPPELYELYDTKIENWRMDGNKSRLGIRNRLVIRALDRLNETERKRMYKSWPKKWERLNDETLPATPDPIYRIDGAASLTASSDRFSDRVYAGTNHDHVVCVAMPFAPPKRSPGAASEPLGSALINGIPAMIWLRAASPEPLDERITQAFWDLVTHQNLSSLPEVVWRQRNDAADTGDDHHMGHMLTLLWDNPHRVPPIGLQDGNDEGMLFEPRMREGNI